MSSLRKTVPIVLSVGAGVVGYRYVRETQPIIIESDVVTNNSLKVRLYTRLPLNAVSRMWGHINDLELPVWAREPLYKLYIWAFNCNLSEAAVTDLTKYRNLGEFFRRQLKPGVRPVDQTAALTCPSDGIVLHCGKISSERVEQVKGVTYSLSQFLGSADWSPPTSEQSKSAEGSDHMDYVRRIKHRDRDTQLYHVIIYLAPGDYHGFHSPTEWTVLFRRYFPGLLLSVNPIIARHVPELFVLNERVVYVGCWQHGFVAMSAVGATNVGSIRVYHDKLLETNTGREVKYQLVRNYQSPSRRSKPVKFSRGDAFGEFNLGSTIVLLFEAPKSFNFTIAPGQKVKYGEELGRC